MEPGNSAYQGIPMSVGPRILVEAAIAQRLVTDLLADGWAVTVNDGEADVVSASYDLHLTLAG